CADRGRRRRPREQRGGRQRLGGGHHPEQVEHRAGDTRAHGRLASRRCPDVTVTRLTCRVPPQRIRAPHLCSSPVKVNTNSSVSPKSTPRLVTRSPVSWWGTRVTTSAPNAPLG